MPFYEPRLAPLQQPLGFSKIVSFADSGREVGLGTGLDERVLIQGLLAALMWSCDWQR